MLAGDLADRIAHVAGIQAEILVVFPSRNFRTLDDDLIQGLIEQLGVVEIGAADGDRQREPTAVDQQTALASFFSPGRSGSDQHIRGESDPHEVLVGAEKVAALLSDLVNALTVEQLQEKLDQALRILSEDFGLTTDYVQIGR